MKNVLFIVYYFPPMGGSGVQRPLKFAKYLREFDWNPIILCPEPGAYQFFDDSLEKELSDLKLDLHRVKATTPFHILGKKKRSTGLVTGLLAKILRWVSRKIYFPDNKKAWIKPAVEKGIRIINNNSIDLIFSNAPPFSNNIIAEQLSTQTGIPFVVDYRDLFSGNHFDDNESDSRINKKLKLEKDWLKKASGVITLDKFSQKYIKKLSIEHDLNTKVIPHGFDQSDFTNSGNPNLDYKEGKLNWLYSGLFYESNQPNIFLKSLSLAFEKIPQMKEEIQLHFQGGLDSRIKNIISKYGLNEHVSDYGYISHDISVANILEADVLWMISNFSKSLKQIKTGKLFEYIGTKKPIFGLVHEGESRKFLKAYEAGFTASPNNEEEIADKICSIYELWKNSKLPVAADSFVGEFERRKLTSELADFFNGIKKRS